MSTFMTFGMTDVCDHALVELLPNLRKADSVHLLLPESRISAEGLRQLHRYKNVKGLSLDRSILTDELLLTLSEFTWIEVLSLDSCTIASGRYAFLRNLSRLRNLDVSDTDFSDLDLDSFPPQSLHDLNLEGTKISKDSLAGFLRHRELRFLRLARTSIRPIDCFILGKLKLLQVCFQ
jgi:hypothetical protein